MGRVGTTAADARFYYHTDHLGSVTAITDEAGNVQWGNEFTPFGSAADSANKPDGGFRFASYEYDEDVELNYALSRWQDPETGRFTSLDPARDGVNWYVYCANNPVAYIDPTGLDQVTITGDYHPENDYISQLELSWGGPMSGILGAHGYSYNPATGRIESGGDPFGTGGPGGGDDLYTEDLYGYKILTLEKVADGLPPSIVKTSELKGPVTKKELEKIENIATKNGNEGIMYILVGYREIEIGAIHLDPRFSKLENTNNDRTDPEALSGKDEDKKIVEQILPAQADPVFRSPLRVHSTQSSGLGMRWSSLLQEWEYHGGVDRVCPQGSEVYATAAGEVIDVHEDRRINETKGGTHITIRHANGYTSHYYHLSAVYVKVGDIVTHDTLIALSGGQRNVVGSGWHTSAPHLHFMIIQNREFKDPNSLIPTWP